MQSPNPAAEPITRFAMVETTLREGEQFATARFTSEQRQAIAQALDVFGVEYLELTSPAASPQSARDLAAIASLGLKARILTHIRCHLDDARLAVEHGAQGVNMLFATSEQLRRASHGRSLDQIIEQAQHVTSYLQQHNIEIRFSCEDTFRTPLADLLRIYTAMDSLGIQRVGLADTVGIAAPRQVYDVVSAVRAAVRCDIEFHGHNDSGCAIANAFCALEAGATHIDVSVLGIGERNGITPLGGFIARLAALDSNLVMRYDLSLLPQLDEMIAEMVGVMVPFNNYITGATAFTHKAGLHTKAVLSDPRSYEVIDPALFGRSRTVAVAHRLTGWHAVAERARELGIVLSEVQARAATTRLKALADERVLDVEDVDELLYEYAE
ncbi:MAG: homocitrate synthase [Chloroflexales bacterium]|nr:homocitrate synthase [Chloroflexales bacterium]